MTKPAKNGGDNNSEPSLTLDLLATTLRDHSAAQVDTNRRFTESFIELEKNTRSMEERLEKSLETRIKAC